MSVVKLRHARTTATASMTSARYGSTSPPPDVSWYEIQPRRQDLGSSVTEVLSLMSPNTFHLYVSGYRVKDSRNQDEYTEDRSACARASVVTHSQCSRILEFQLVRNTLSCSYNPGSPYESHSYQLCQCSHRLNETGRQQKNRRQAGLVSNRSLIKGILQSGFTTTSRRPNGRISII